MKICLVTGGSRGIGAATATKFAHAGYTVIVNYNQSKSQAEALQKQLLGEGCDVHLFQADVSLHSQVADMFAWVGKYFKHLDVLVNNAGISCNAQIQDVTADSLNKVFGTNVFSAFYCCREALPLFAKAGGGVVVNVSSVWGVNGASCESVYSASKHAVVGLTKSLAAELSPLNVKVNCVCPPIVATDMCAHLSQSDVARFCDEHGTRLYTPQQVADDIYSLALGAQTGKILLEK